MKEDCVEVITLSPAREIVRFSARVVEEEGKYGIKYLGDFYQIHLEKVLLDKKDAT